MSERAAWWVLGGLCALFLVPLWLPDHLPLVDFGCRADDLYILDRLLEEGSGFDRWYVVDNWWHPKMFARLLLLPLASVFGADAALRCFYSLYLVGAPLAVAFALRQLRASPWPALLVFPGLWSFPVGYGFGIYAVSTVALVVTYALWERWSDGLSVLRWLTLAGASAVLFLLHPQAWLFWVVTGATLTGIAWLSGRAGAGYFAGVVTSFVTGVPLLLHFVGFAYDVDVDPIRSKTFVWFPGPVHRLRELPGHLGAYWDDPLAPTLLAAFVLVAVLAWRALRPTASSSENAVESWGSEEGDGWRERLWRARWLVVCLAFVGGTFAIPESYGPQHFIASRFPSMAVLVLPLALATSPGWRDRRVVGSAVLLAGMCGLVMVGRMTVFDAESARLSRAAEQIPEGASFQCAVDLRWTMVHTLPAYDCTCSWAHMERGGLCGHLPHQTGVSHVPELHTSPRDHGSWQDAPSELFHYGTWGNFYDYWLVRAKPGPTALDGPRLSPYFEKTFEDGLWRVYRRTRPFPPGFNVPGVDPTRPAAP